VNSQRNGPRFWVPFLYMGGTWTIVPGARPRSAIPNAPPRLEGTVWLVAIFILSIVGQPLGELFVEPDRCWLVAFRPYERHWTARTPEEGKSAALRPGFVDWLSRGRRGGRLLLLGFLETNPPPFPGFRSFRIQQVLTHIDLPLERRWTGVGWDRWAKVGVRHPVGILENASYSFGPWALRSLFAVGRPARSHCLGPL